MTMLPTKHKSRDQLLDFQPAALEILEKPASPAGRYLAYALIALFSIAVLWACFGRVDVVASAEGKIIPGGRVKLIQPLQMGVVKQIFVDEGQRVEAGQALIELDQTLSAADVARLSSDYDFLQHKQQRNRILIELVQNEANLELDNDKITAHVQEQLARDSRKPRESAQQRLIEQAWFDYRAQHQILHSQIQSRQSELDSALASIAKYQATLPLVSKRVDALKSLHAHGMGAEAQLLELQENQITQQQNLLAEEAHAEQIRHTLEELHWNRQALRGQTLNQLLSDNDDIDSRQRSLQQELNKASDLNAKHILSAPVTGRVKQLAVHTIGGVVEEAKVLMQIVPEEDFLEVEAVLPNKDIGFVNQGQRAEIKIHTFPFTKYGVIDAEVLDITADAIESEQQGLVYTVRLKMRKTQLWVDQRWVDLIPGMAVTAEVKTNKRRVIEFFLSPLLRYKDESVRER